MNYCQFRNDVIKRMANSGGGGLPTRYQQVEYLQNTGGSYIVTQQTNDAGQTIDYAFMVDRFKWDATAGTSANCRIFSTSSLASQLIIINTQTPHQYLAMNNATSTSTRPTTPQFATGIKYSVTQYPSAAISINGVTYSGQNYGGATTKSGFNLYTGSTGSIIELIGKIYYFRVTADSSQTVIDLIPCYRKSDNKPGMYDLVTNTFFTNAGTGEFIAGNNV